MKAKLTAKKKRIPADMAGRPLSWLCDRVIAMDCAYEDVAEQVEDTAYAEFEQGRLESAIGHLCRVTGFLEQLESKNEENCRDLADVYVLIGEIYQYADRFTESISWFEKAVLVDDTYAIPYHSLAASFISLHTAASAIKCLEQEITVAPENYYSYLLLADMYEKQGDEKKFVDVLQRLLSRDTDNIRALHRLIVHYERHSPRMDVSLLRRRILTADRTFDKMELMIWTYHMCAAKRFADALSFIQSTELESPGLTITRLLKARVYGLMHQFTKKRLELAEFKRLNHGSGDIIHSKLVEFSSVFGEPAAKKLERRLVVAKPTRTIP